MFVTKISGKTITNPITSLIKNRITKITAEIAKTIAAAKRNHANVLMLKISVNFNLSSL